MQPIQRFLIGEGERFSLDENGDEAMFSIENYHVNKVVCQKCGGGFGSVINSVDDRGVHRHVCDYDTVYIHDGYLSPMVDYEYFENALEGFYSRDTPDNLPSEIPLRWFMEQPQ